MTKCTKKLKSFLFKLYQGKCWIYYNFIQIAFFAIIFSMILIEYLDNGAERINITFLEILTITFILMEVILRIFLFNKRVIRSPFFWLDILLLISYIVWSSLNLAKVINVDDLNMTSLISLGLRLIVQITRGIMAIIITKRRSGSYFVQEREVFISAVDTMDFDDERRPSADKDENYCEEDNNSFVETYYRKKSDEEKKLFTSNDVLYI